MLSASVRNPNECVNLHQGRFAAKELWGRTEHSRDWRPMGDGFRSRSFAKFAKGALLRLSESAAYRYSSRYR